jgi:hypothetical protein
MNTELNTELNTPTPRTNAAARLVRSTENGVLVHAEHARTLERELATERARLDYVLKNDCAWNDRSEIDEDIKNMSGESKK